MINLRNEIEKDNERLKNVHSHLQHLSVGELQKITENDRLPYAVAFLNLTGSLNISTMIRTAHIMGAAEVFIFGRNSYDKRGLVGSDKYTKINRMGGLINDFEIDPEYFFESLKGYKPVLIEQHETSHNAFSFKWDYIPDKPCFVFGREGTGIQQSIIDLVEERNILCLEVPQFGVIRSLNVSSTMAMITGLHVAKAHRGRTYVHNSR